MRFKLSTCSLNLLKPEIGKTLALRELITASDQIHFRLGPSFKQDLKLVMAESGDKAGPLERFRRDSIGK